MQQLASKVVFNTTIEEPFTPIRIENIIRCSIHHLDESNEEFTPESVFE